MRIMNHQATKLPFTKLKKICTFPAFIKSAFTWEAFGYGPTPNMPFYDCRLIWTPYASTEGNRVGMPIPKFIFIPFPTYFDARRIIFNLFYWAGSIFFSPYDSSWTVNFYILFYDHGLLGSAKNTLSTKTAATWTSLGSICPGSTISSTYAMTHFAEVAISALKFLAVWLK